MEIYQSYSKNTKNVPYFQVQRTVQKFKTHNTESLNKVQNSRNGNTLVWSQNVKKLWNIKLLEKEKHSTIDRCPLFKTNLILNSEWNLKF